MKKSFKGSIPAGSLRIVENISKKDSITGVSGDKSGWAAELDLSPKGEYTFFAGCGYQCIKYAEGMMQTARGMEKMGLSMNQLLGISRTFSNIGVDLPSITAKISSAWKADTYTNILRRAINVLKKLGLEVGYLYEEEPCCGSPLYYNGFVDECIEKAKKNFELFKSREIRKIIGMIPACTSLLKNFYPRQIEGYNLESWHFLEIVSNTLRQKNLKPALKTKTAVTYHDPCQLSRYLHIIDEPREIMNSIEGLELREPKAEQTRQWSTCCGGGGLEAVDPELSGRLGIRRLEELLATGASTIVTSCPACLMQLRTSAKRMKKDIQIVDLVEIIDEALG